VVEINADNLPWALISLLVAALLAVFYAMLRGAILPRSVADQLRESEGKRAEVAEAGVQANTKSVESLVDSVAKLMVLAEGQERVLAALHDRIARGNNPRRGGPS
jgi:uncharacterized sporulation protein YeaH/YhbH (DUF444 family)